MIDVPDALDDFVAKPFTADGVTHPVYRIGRGPAVILLHELPCITPECANLARRIAGAGMTVFMPSLTGTPGRPFTAGYGAAGVARLCVNREFAVFAARASSPIADFLRALCHAAHAELGGPGVGVIGMCMTGNFAIGLMADEHVIAPVACQPSLPFGSLAGRDRELHISPAELAQIKRRDTTLLGLRFTGDPLCPAGRFARLREELGDRFEAIEIDSSRHNPHGHRRIAHSVLTLDLIDGDGQPTRAARERVIGFLRERLLA